MEIERKSITSFWKAGIAVAIAIAFMLPGSAVFTNGYGGISSSGTMAIEWSVTLNFNEDGGKLDYAVFGEAPDANDGESPDSYDEPKPPAPMPPYLRAWFDDDLPMPYNALWEDYRSYPDTVKVWDLYVRWRSSNSTPIIIDVSWDISEFVGIEYGSIVLNRYDPFDGEWDFVVDMLIEDSYAYTPLWFNEQWLTDHFQINATTNNPPYVPSSPNPVDGATDVDVDAVLSWTGGDPDPGDTVTYDVYFGTSSPPLQVIGNQSGTSYDPGTMSYGTQYYWQIVAWDNHGASTDGPIWNFITGTQPNNPPEVPSKPNPPNGAVYVDIDADLSWTGGDQDDGDIVTYDVYFGTTPDPPYIATIGPYPATQTLITYDPETLDYETTYYWKIIATDDHSAFTEGLIWNFITEEEFLVGWGCYLDFTEPGDGYDNAFFGEKNDASDGPDGYDVPKSPPGMTPYIRAWFDTGFPDPHDELWKEYKQYPDDYKVWNLTVQWVPSDTSPTDITISWDISCLSTTEYIGIKLKNMGSGETVNMLVEENYTFNASALTPYHFQIICSIEIHITDLQSKWNLISVPFNQPVPKDNIIVRYDDVDYSWAAATSDNNPTGGPIVLGYIYCWNRNMPQHYELSDVIEPGYGYWMYAFYDCDLWITYFDGMIDNGYITDLVTTWNIMGLPNDVPLPKEDMIVRYNGVDYSWGNATSDNNPTGGPIVLGYIYYWSASMPQHYELSDVFEPGYGYWMYAYYGCTVKRETFAPIIIDNSPDTAGTGNGFIFNASVSDSDGIDIVWVEYWYDDGTHLNDFMNQTGVDDYYEKMITIPSDSVDPLHYIISANDTYNFWSNTGEQTVTVIDDDAPEYSWILKPEDGTTGESVLVNVSATDNIGVTYYKIIVDSVEYDMDNYTYIINIPENSISGILYNCTFKDAQGNRVNTDDVTITVTDNDRPEISNVQATPPSTSQGGFVNITCTVTDNIAVDTVNVSISGPPSFDPVNISMNEGSYYYNESYTIIGTYDFFIWANDTSGNSNTSIVHQFDITALPNNPPTISNENPANGSINVDPTLSTLAAYISDDDGDEMQWKIWDPFGAWNASTDNNRIISIDFVGLTYSTTYYWHVNVTDGHDWTNKTFHFTTRDQYVPVEPVDFTADVYNTTQINLTWVVGSNADYTYIEWNSTESWNRGEGTEIHNGTGTSFDDVGLSPHTQYFYQAWSYNVTDNTWSTYVGDNDTTFNTPPSFGTPSPANDSIDQDLSLLWSIPISDVDGDSFDWSIECSNGQVNSSTGASDGVKELSISGLAYDTTYMVWVNATDGYDWTREWFIFTTREDNDAPEITNVQATPDTQEVDGFINITCDVIDDGGVDAVFVNITYPDLTTENLSMDVGSYHKNQTYLMPGTYDYFIWANDTSGNSNISGGHTFYIYDPSVVYVDDDFGPSTEGWQIDHFNVIQDGIDTVTSGGTVHVMDGVYDEQLNIGKELTLDAESFNTIVQPSAIPQLGIYDVEIDASSVLIQDFMFDFNDADDTRGGQGIVISDLDGPAATNVKITNSIIYSGDGSGLGGTCIQTGKNADVSGLNISGNTFYGDFNGMGEGVYVNPGPGANIVIKDNEFNGYLFAGVSIEASNVTVSNNTIDSDISTGIYGVRFIDLTGGKTFDTVTISYNDIANVSYGIRIGTSTDVGSTLTASIEYNNINNCGVGIWVRYGADLGDSIHYNNLGGNTDYGIKMDATGDVNASYNWWGDASGPYHPVTNSDGLGDNVSDNVDYIPWLDASYPGGNPTSNPPVITNVVANPDSQVVGGFVNISCDVTDDVAVDSVWINITYPDLTTENLSMDVGSYYKNQTYDAVGMYQYLIWANDASGNSNVSDGHTFSIVASQLLVNSEFDDSSNSTDLIADAPGQDWYERRDDDSQL